VHGAQWRLATDRSDGVPGHAQTPVHLRGRSRHLADSALGRGILLDNVAQEIARRGKGRLHALQAMRERSELHGFGVNLGDVVPGIHAFAVPVLDAQGQALGAICLMGTPELYGEERLQSIHQALLDTAEVLHQDARKFNI
jgi:DNA-binding IclR family transcriptional regulator